MPPSLIRHRLHRLVDRVILVSDTRSSVHVRCRRIGQGVNPTRSNSLDDVAFGNQTDHVIIGVDDNEGADIAEYELLRNVLQRSLWPCRGDAPAFFIEYLSNGHSR